MTLKVTTGISCDDESVGNPHTVHVYHLLRDSRTHNGGFVVILCGTDLATLRLGYDSGSTVSLT